MIDRIAGKLVAREAMHVVIDAHGIGFRVECTTSMAGLLGAIGDQATLFTQLVMSQDQLPRLFGFTTLSARRLFVMLTSVDGVGPTTALKIMTAHQPHQIARAIVDGQESGLKAKGVGPKIAARLIAELKDKVPELLSASDSPTAGSPMTSQITTASADAVLALQALEIDAKNARQKVADAVARLGAITATGDPVTLTADEIVRDVLLHL